MATIIVLSCKGGGGHSTAAQAIMEALPEHSVKIIDFLGESLAPIDPFFWISRGRYTGQDLYNFLLKKNYKRLINALYHIGCLLVWIRHQSIQDAYQALLHHHKPSLCISVIPLVNSSLSCVAKKNKIPLLIVPTDFDIRTFLKGLTKQKSNYTWLAGGLFDKSIRSFILPKMIEQTKVYNIGFPIRKEFFQSYCKDTLLKRLRIGHNKRIILLLMGSTGSRSLIDYCKALEQLSIKNIHIIVCLAKSQHLANKIKALSFPSYIRCSILPSSVSIAQAMSIADLCITKPGSVTFAETMYSNCVVFLDATTPLVIWESFNIHLVKKCGNGLMIADRTQICYYVERFFNDDPWRTKMMHHTQAIEKKNFGIHLSGLVLTILSMSTTKKEYCPSL